MGRFRCYTAPLVLVKLLLLVAVLQCANAKSTAATATLVPRRSPSTSTTRGEASVTLPHPRNTHAATCLHHLYTDLYIVAVKQSSLATTKQHYHSLLSLHKNTSSTIGVSQQHPPDLPALSLNTPTPPRSFAASTSRCEATPPYSPPLALRGCRLGNP